MGGCSFYIFNIAHLYQFCKVIGYILPPLKRFRHFRQSKKEHGYICNALKEYQDILDTLKRPFSEIDR